MKKLSILFLIFAILNMNIPLIAAEDSSTTTQDITPTPEEIKEAQEKAEEEEKKEENKEEYIEEGEEIAIEAVATVVEEVSSHFFNRSYSKQVKTLLENEGLKDLKKSVLPSIGLGFLVHAAVRLVERYIEYYDSYDVGVHVYIRSNEIIDPSINDNKYKYIYQTEKDKTSIGIYVEDLSSINDGSESYVYNTEVIATSLEASAYGYLHSNSGAAKESSVGGVMNSYFKALAYEGVAVGLYTEDNTTFTGGEVITNDGDSLTLGVSHNVFIAEDARHNAYCSDDGTYTADALGYTDTYGIYADGTWGSYTSDYEWVGLDVSYNTIISYAYYGDAVGIQVVTSTFTSALIGNDITATSVHGSATGMLFALDAGDLEDVEKDFTWHIFFPSTTPEEEVEVDIDTGTLYITTISGYKSEWEDNATIYVANTDGENGGVEQETGATAAKGISFTGGSYNIGEISNYNIIATSVGVGAYGIAFDYSDGSNEITVGTLDNLDITVSAKNGLSVGIFLDTQSYDDDGNWTGDVTCTEAFIDTMSNLNISVTSAGNVYGYVLGVTLGYNDQDGGFAFYNSAFGNSESMATNMDYSSISMNITSTGLGSSIYGGNAAYGLYLYGVDYSFEDTYVVVAEDGVELYKEDGTLYNAEYGEVIFEEDGQLIIDKDDESIVLLSSLDLNDYDESIVPLSSVNLDESDIDTSSLNFSFKSIEVAAAGTAYAVYFDNSVISSTFSTTITVNTMGALNYAVYLVNDSSMVNLDSTIYFNSVETVSDIAKGYVTGVLIDSTSYIESVNSDIFVDLSYYSSTHGVEIKGISIGSADSLGSFTGSVSTSTFDGTDFVTSENFYGYLIGKTLASEESLLLYNDDSDFKNSEGVNIDSLVSLTINDIISDDTSMHNVYGAYVTGADSDVEIDFSIGVESGVGIAVYDGASVLLSGSISGIVNYIDGTNTQLELSGSLMGDTYVSNGAALKLSDVSLSNASLEISNSASLDILSTASLYGVSLDIDSTSSLNFDAYASLYLDADSNITFSTSASINIDLSEVEDAFSYVLISTDNDSNYSYILDYLNSENTIITLSSVFNDLEYSDADYGDNYDRNGVDDGINNIYYEVIFKGDGANITMSMLVIGDFEYFKWDTDDYGNTLLTATTDSSDSDISAYSKVGRIRLVGGTDAEDLYYSFVNLSDTDGGAIYNYADEDILLMGNITGDFVGNYAYSSSSARGGAIYNYALGYMLLIADIEGDFVGNYAYSEKSFTRGGSISNMAMGSSITFGEITGDFLSNYAYSLGGTSSVQGGAIYNYTSADSASSIYIEGIEGDFTTNYAFSATDSAQGGAIFNESLADSSITIDYIEGDFTGNYVASYGEGSTSAGGAIYNNATGASIVLNDVSSSFIGNYAYTNSASGSSHGGAIYNSASSVGESTINLDASEADIYFTGNYTSIAGLVSYSAIYNTADSQSNAIINFKTDDDYKIVVNDAISGSSNKSNQILNIDGSVEFNNEVSFQTINVDFGTLNLGVYEGTSDLYADGTNIALESSIASLDNVILSVADEATLYISTNDNYDSVNIYSSTINIADGATIMLEAYASLYIAENSSITFGDGAIFSIDFTGVYDSFSYNLFSIESEDAYYDIKDFLSDTDNIDLNAAYSLLDALSAEIIDTTYAYGDDVLEYDDDGNASVKVEFVFNLIYDDSAQSIDIELDPDGEFVYFNWSKDELGNLLLVETDIKSLAEFITYSSDNTQVENATDGEEITSSFLGLSSTNGAAIYNYNTSDATDISMGNITGDFVGNVVSARGGAIYNHTYSSDSDFSNNIIIGDITGVFVANSAYSDSSFTRGGVISNMVVASTYISIGTITGDFTSNSAYSLLSDSATQGGAIYNYTYAGTDTACTYISINGIDGNFTGNYAYSATASASGGAIHNEAYAYSSISLGIITGDFIGNYVCGENAYGGAIYNHASGTEASVDLTLGGSFIGNYAYATYEAENALGGAIYNYASGDALSTVNIYASDDDIYFTGNYANNAGEITSSAIYNYAASSSASSIINFNTSSTYSIVVNDAISGSDYDYSLSGQVLNIAGTVEFNNEVSYQTININSGTLSLGSYDGTKDLYEDETYVEVLDSIASLDNVVLTVNEGATLSIATNEDYDSVNLYDSTVNITNGGTLSFDLNAKLYIDLNSSINLSDDIYFKINLNGTTGSFDFTILEFEDSTVYSEALAYLQSLYLTMEVGVSIAVFGDDFYNIAFEGDDEEYSIDISTYLAGEITYFDWGLLGSTDNVILVEVENEGYVGEDSISAYSASNNRIIGSVSCTTYADMISSFVGLSDVQESYEARGGAIYNESSDVEISIGELYGDFIGNYANSAGSYSQGGAVYNYATNYKITMGNMTSRFVGNSAFSTASYAQGGAIYNNAESSKISIGYLIGNFEYNYAYTSNSYYAELSAAQGGAIYNYTDNDSSASIDISGIKGNFTNNYTYATNVNDTGVSQGGAIYNESHSEIIIDNITGNFTSNYADVTVVEENAGNQKAQGGAIYNYTTDGGSIEIAYITGNFLGNYAYALYGEAQGGAIYNYAESGSIDMTLLISSGDIEMTGNYVQNGDTVTSNAIYNEAGESGTSTINFLSGYGSTLSINDGISGGSDNIENQILSINATTLNTDYTGTVAFNNVVEYQSINVYNGTLSLGGYDGTDDLFADVTEVLYGEVPVVSVEASIASLVDVVLTVGSGATLEIGTNSAGDDVSISNSTITMQADSILHFDDCASVDIDYDTTTIDIDDSVVVEFDSQSTSDLTLASKLEFLLEEASAINHIGEGSLTVYASLHESTTFNLTNGTLNFAGASVDGILNISEGADFNIIINSVNAGCTNILTGTLSILDEEGEVSAQSYIVDIIIADIFEVLDSTSSIYAEDYAYADIIELNFDNVYTTGVSFDKDSATLVVDDIVGISQAKDDDSTASLSFSIVDSANTITVLGDYLLEEGESYNIDIIAKADEESSLTLDGGEISLNENATLSLGGDNADIIVINGTLNATEDNSLINILGDIEVGDLNVSGYLYGDSFTITGSSLTFNDVELSGSISFEDILLSGTLSYNITKDTSLAIISEEDSTLSASLNVENNGTGELIVYSVTNSSGNITLEDGAKIILSGNGYALANDHNYTGDNGLNLILKGSATLSSVKANSPLTITSEGVTSEYVVGSFADYVLTVAGDITTANADASSSISEDITVTSASLVLSGTGTINTGGGDINLFGASLTLANTTLSEVDSINLSTNIYGDMSKISLGSSSLGDTEIAIVGSASMLKDAAYDISSDDIEALVTNAEYGTFTTTYNGTATTTKVDSLSYFQENATTASEIALAYALDEISANGESIGDSIYDAKVSFKLSLDEVGLDYVIMNSYSNIAEVNSMLLSNINFANVNRARGILDKNSYSSRMSEEEIIKEATGVNLIESEEVALIKYTKVAQLQSINFLGSKDSVNGAAGYDYWSVGSVANIDKILSEYALVGMSVGGTYNKTEGDNGDNANATAFLLNAYGVIKSGIYPFELFANVGYAHFWNEASKNGFASKWDSDAFNVLGGIAFDLETGVEDLNFKPLAMLNMLMLNSESTSYSNFIDVDSQSYMSVKLMLGFEVEYAISSQFNATIRAMYSHEFSDESYDFTYGFANGFSSDIAYVGSKSGRDSAVLGLNLSYDFSETCTAYFDYNAYIYESLTTHSLNLSVGIKF